MFFNARRDLAAKQVGAELMIYDSANKVIHVLNTAAATIFQLCDGSHTPEEIAKALEETFDDVERVQAYEDVKRTLEVLEAKQLLEK